MGGGLLQLAAIGEQDLFLSGNPQITFFKTVHRRHTNFSIEAIEQIITGNILNDGCSIYSNISDNGDLVSNMWLDVLLPTIPNQNDGNYYVWCNNTGHALIDEIECELGEQIIDKHDGKWLDIDNELYNNNNNNNDNENILINKHNLLNGYYNILNNNLRENLQLYIPLKFWFNKNIGLSLPLIALQYHKLKIKMKLRNLKSLINSNNDLNGINFVDDINVKLYCNYIYLDVDERKRFAQSSHEYLIEQIQSQKKKFTTKNELFFNHPVKEIFWVIQNNICNNEGLINVDPLQNIININLNLADWTNNNDYFNYNSPNYNQNNASYAKKEFINSQINYEHFKKCNIDFNGIERFTSQKASYFKYVIPYQNYHKLPKKNIYMYSFAIKPDEHQPSGSCNFSKINNSNLLFEEPANHINNNVSLFVYAINYNVIRIMSGMVGLVYSN